MRKTAILLSAALIVSGAAGASAQTIEDRLAQARTERQRAVLTVELLRDTLSVLRDERRRLQDAMERAAADLLKTYARELDAATRLDHAQEQLATRARMAYQLGPAASLAFLLSADSPADLVAAQEFTASALDADVEAINEVEIARSELAFLRAEVERRQQSLNDREVELESLLIEMERRIAEAQEAAKTAGLRVRELEEERAAILVARARMEALEAFLLDPSRGADQSDLLALLGPTGGRTCQVPEGLEDTGENVVGDASWYGWDFAGQSTASGAIFDPRLFTAANRDLPFGTFLRIRYNGRCAVVLVNDRGPYGNYDRVIDLSLGAAAYLGIGVSPVVADILVPIDR
jgi:peptidoglycan hydrolase CwlO-like protein